MYVTTCIFLARVLCCSHAHLNIKAWSIARRIITSPGRAWRTSAIRLYCHHQEKRDDYRKPTGLERQ